MKCKCDNCTCPECKCLGFACMLVECSCDCHTETVAIKSIS
jgi:hypothetical protein